MKNKIKLDLNEFDVVELKTKKRSYGIMLINNGTIGFKEFQRKSAEANAYQKIKRVNKTGTLIRFTINSKIELGSEQETLEEK